MRKTIDVVAALLVRQGKILLAQRPPDADQPGMWEFAGGKVETGESQRAALIRELREELGIEAQPACHIVSHLHTLPDRQIHLHGWYVPVFHGEPTAYCHSMLRWCTPEEARNYPLAPADIPLLEAFMALNVAR